MPPNYTVHSKDLKKGAKIEQNRHPTISETMARRLARDNLRSQGPAAYRVEPMVDQMRKNINRKMGARPIKRRMPPKPFDPLYDDPFAYYRRHPLR